MAFLGKARKEDLVCLAEELGEIPRPQAKVVDLKNLIVKSKSYEGEFVKELLDTIITARVEKTEAENEEKRRKFELEKLRAQDENRTDRTNQGPVMNYNASFELTRLMPKFNLKENDIVLYLSLFEKQAQRSQVDTKNWVSCLLTLLPPDIVQIIARQSGEELTEYKEVKTILLNRFKLTPESFRKKFSQHQKKPEGSWRDFAFEMKNYFEEWIEGLNVKDFNGLKDLIVTDQIKKRVPSDIREHLLDDWSKITSPTQLADKLDEHESLRADSSKFKFGGAKGGFGGREHYSSSSQTKFRNNYFADNGKNEATSQDTFRSRTSPQLITNTRQQYVPRREEKGKTICYACGDEGHIARVCEKNQMTLPRIQSNIIHRSEVQSPNPVQVSRKSVDSMESSVYIKSARINGVHQVNSLIDTGSSSCILRESAAKELRLKVYPEAEKLYGFGNQGVPSATTLGRTIADIEIDGVLGRSIVILIVKDDAQPIDLIIGRTWIDLPHIMYCKNGNKLHISSVEPLIENRNSVNVELGKQNPIQQESTTSVELPHIFNINVNAVDVPEIGLQHIEDEGIQKNVLDLIQHYRPEKIKETSIRMNIILKDEIPIYQRPRRLSPCERAEVNEQIEKWLEEKIIKPSCSEYASPIVIVRKKDGKARICVDYRSLNKKIIKDRYPLGTRMNVTNSEDIQRIIEEENILMFSEARDKIREGARESIKKIQEENRKSFNKRRTEATKYKEGDIVAIRRTQYAPSSKLLSHYIGPYRITKIMRNDRYVVAKIGFHDGPNSTTTAADYMKPWLAAIHSDEYSEE